MSASEMNAAAEAFRTSPQQRRAWTLHTGGDWPGGPFGLHAKVAVRGRFTSSRLLSALRTVVEGNEILRAAIGLAPGLAMPVMRLPPSSGFMAPVTDLTSVSREEARLAVNGCFAAKARLGVDLAGPLFTAHVFQLAVGEHRLILSLANAAGDVAALGDLIAQLGQALAEEAGWAAEKLQYPDLAEWQLQLLEGEDGEGGRSFWEKRGDAVAVPQPLLLETTGEGPFQPLEQRFPVPEQTMQAVRTLAATAGTDPEAVWLAAWGWLLARLADRPGGVLGLLADGRRMEELRSVQGPFARYLPLDYEAEPGETLVDLARRLDNRWQEMLAWQEVFDPSSRDAPAHLFEIRPRIAPVKAEACEIEVLALRSLSERFTTRLAVETAGPASSDPASSDPASSDPAPALVLGIDSRHLQVEDMRRWASGLTSLLEAAARHPEATLDTLPLHSREEGRHLLMGQQPAMPAAPEDVIDAFAGHAAAKPDANALITASGAKTYGELSSAVAELADRLVAAGVGPEVVVGVHLPRDHRLIEAVLAVMTAGGAYLALDPTYPWRRLAGAMEDAGAQVLITDPAQDSELARGFEGTLLELPLTASVPDGEAELRVRPVAPQNAAYVLFTSGSTGRPKGVVIDRRSLAASTAARPVHYQQPVGVFLLVSSLSFDSSVAGLFWTLATGGTLALPPDGFQHDVPQLLADAERWGVTHLLALPALWRLLLEQEEAPARLMALRCAIVAGEACPESLVELHRERLPAAGLHNEYGPTEGTVWATVAELTSEPEGAGEPTIGSPAAHARIYISAGVPEPGSVPSGVAGELLVGGSGVARGYVGRPAETAARFLPDPWSDVPDARLYRTGDRAWLRRDGAAMFLGRADRQIKVRGHRIEPAEVEAVLGGHPALRAVAVAVKSGPGDAPRLLAWVEADEEIGAEGVQDWLRERLPEPLVPSRVMRLDALPRLPNGKLDRQTLLSAKLSPARAPYVAPQGEIERILAEVWGEVLHQTQVGAEDNFFQLGGDSIQSVRVRALAASRGIEISVQDLFHHRTVRALAGRARRADPAPVESAPTPFEGLSANDLGRLPATAEDAFSLSALQAGMLFESERDPAAGHYVDAVSFDLQAPFDAGALRRALGSMVEAHPVLRTSFHLRGFEQPLQVVHRSAEIPLEVVESGGEVPSAEAVLAQQRSRPFDPAVAPLLRLQVHLLDSEHFRLTLCDHHAILDGWSSATFLTTLMRLYRGHVEGSPVEPPATPPTGLRQAVAEERRTLEDPTTAAFWERWLAGAPRGVLPPRVGPAAEAVGKRTLSVEIPLPVATGLRRLAEELGLPLRSVLLAAHLRCLAELTGETEVVSGLVTHSRPEAEGGEQALGLFLNTLPFRLRLRPGSWRDLVEQVHAAEAEMIPHRRFPLAELVRRRGGALFDAAFNYVHFHVQRQVGELSGFEVLSTTAEETTELPLVVHFQSAIDGPGLIGELILDSDRLGHDQAEALAALYPRVLARMSARPEDRHDRFEPVPAPTSRPQQQAPAPGTPLAHRLQELAGVEGQAILGEVGELSWRDFASRALGVAGRLRDLGIRAEEPLPLLLRRGLEETVAFIGVLTGPGVPLPLEPGDPPERLSRALAGTGARRALVSGPFSELASSLGLEPLTVEELAPSSAAGEESIPTVPALHTEQLGYLISTSGSTGVPRRVAITAGHATGHGEAMTTLLGLSPQDRLLQFAGWTFDLALEDLYTALAAGATLVVRGPELWDPARLDETLQSAEVTVASLPTAIAHAWIRSRGVRPAPSRLRAVLVGGEALDPEIVAGWRRGPLAGVELINHYGPAEVTIAATAWRLPASGWDGGGPVPIGYALDGRDARVVGPFGRLASSGVAGELLLGGRLARGYWDASATADRFVPDDVSGREGGRLYRSGDRVTGLESDGLVFLGRRDLQLKVRGVRVEPGEVEAALEEHPSVRQAVVRSVGEGGEARLCAWIEAGTSRPEAAELIAHLRHRLPPAMLPAAWSILDALPRTAGGKVDLQALPSASAVTAEDRTPPDSDGELQVAAVWSRLLGVDELAAEDDFFLLGGHSLLATRAVAELRESTGVGLALAEMLAERTVRGVGRLIDRRRGAGAPATERGGQEEEAWEEIEI